MSPAWPDQQTSGEEGNDNLRRGTSAAQNAAMPSKITITHNFRRGRVKTVIMRKILVTMVVLLSLMQLASAQRDAATMDWKSRLWYGGNAILGFSASDGFSQFQFGVSPMVGYKINEIFSLGPRATIVYNNIGIRDLGGDVNRVNTATLAAGVFGRARFARNLFVQGEYIYESQPFVDSNAEVFRLNRANAYAGLGYTTSRGSGWGTEVMITYNLTLPVNTIQSPFDYRFGFTFNF